MGEQERHHHEIRAQWDDRDFWTRMPALVDQINSLIKEFNERRRKRAEEQQSARRAGAR
jgi:hypothetical protein